MVTFTSYRKQFTIRYPHISFETMYAVVSLAIILGLITLFTLWGVSSVHR
jgi:hypothetical protein